MYEIGYSGGLKTRRTNRAEIPSPIGTQLKYDIDRKQDVTIEAEDDDVIAVTFAPYHAIEVVDYTISATEGEDPTDANCPEEESGTVLFDGVITLSSGGDALLAGTVTLADAFEAGYYYTIELNGNTISQYASYDSEQNCVQIYALHDDEETMSVSGVIISDMDGGAQIMCSTDVGTEGENTLTITKADVPELEGTLYYDGTVTFPDDYSFVSLDGAGGVAADVVYFIRIDDKTFMAYGRPSGQMITAATPWSEDGGVTLRSRSSGENPEIAASVVGSHHLKVTY